MSQTAPATFAARLKALREAAGFTQDELATIAGLSINAISALERGERRRPQLDTVRALAAALDLDEPARHALLAAARPGDTGTAATPFGHAPLPIPSTALVGRDADVKAVADLLSVDGARLVTLVGPGGVGKTRLAIDAARDLQARLPIAVAFIPLAPVNDSAQLAGAIAEALGMSDLSVRDLAGRLAALSAERETLLVLDNFEHLVEAAPLIGALLSAAAGLRVLVTSRSPLRIRGEREYAVAPLALPRPDGRCAAIEASRSPAVRLFVERIRDMQPHFRVTDANAPTLVAICRRLDALPLALELAAAWLKALTPEQLLDHIDRNLTPPAVGARDLPARQQTMRATVAWSYDLLSSDEQASFRRVGLIPGRITIDAAAAVIAPAPGRNEQPALDVVAGLLDKSLLARADGGLADRASYVMLETVRAYGLSKLDESGERGETMERLVCYCGRSAEAAGLALEGPDQSVWLDRVRDDLDSYRAAVAWLLTERRHAEAAAIAWPLVLFFMIRGHVAEGLHWFERILSAPALDPATEARALVGAALMWYMQREHQRACPLVDRAGPLAEAAGALDALGGGLNLRGYVALGMADVEGAREAYGRLLALCDSIPGHGVWLRGSALNGLANASLMSGDIAGAERLLDDAERTLRPAGCWWPLAVTLNIRGSIALARGRSDDAIAVMRDCLRLVRPLRDVFALIHCLLIVAAASARQQDDIRAARLLGAMDTMTRTAGVAAADHYSYELRQRTERDVRARLTPAMFDRPYAAGSQASIDGLLDEIERVG